MEENEQKDDVAVPQEATPVVEESNDTPTLEDYERIAKENKTLQEQKEHWRKKAEAIKSQPLNKNNEQSFTRDEAILIASGHTIDEVDLALKLSKVKNVPLSEAVKDEFFTFTVEERKKKEMSEKASLGASSSAPFKTDKPIDKMDEKEHRDLFEKALG